MKARRRAWFDGQLDLDPSTLIFIDETSASTKMARLGGRARKGERCRASVPHGHWKTTTFTAGLRLDGLIAPMLLDGPMNGPAFLAYAEQVLAPELRPGDLVDHGQPSRPQDIRRPRGDRKGRRQPAPSPALFARLQPDRDGLLQAQGASAEGGSPNHRRPLDRDRQTASTSSRRPNAVTISKQQDMTRSKSNPLSGSNPSPPATIFAMNSKCGVRTPGRIRTSCQSGVLTLLPPTVINGAVF